MLYSKSIKIVYVGLSRLDRKVFLLQVKNFTVGDCNLSHANMQENLIKKLFMHLIFRLFLW
jgi:hypothetical protein